MAKNWYLVVLGSRLEELYSLESTTDVEEVDKINDTVEILESLIFDEGFSEVEANFGGIINYERDWLSSIEPYSSIYRLLANREYMKLSYKNVPLKKYSDKELLEIVGDFYGSVLDSELYRKFRAMYKKSNKYVYMGELGEMEDDGDAIFLPYFNEVFIRVKRHNTMTDLGSLTHEYGHGIQYLTNFSRQLYNEKFMFSEIVSSFFEILIKDYLKANREFKNAAVANDIFYYNRRNLRARRVLEMIRLFHKWSEIDVFEEKGAKKKMNRDIASSQIFIPRELQNIDDLLDANIPIYAPYIFAYVIAIEIFLIYSEDKKRGLELLKRIMEIELDLPNEVYYQKLMSMGFGKEESLEEYEKVLKMRCSINF